jgi:hypothetical protein
MSARQHQEQEEMCRDRQASKEQATKVKAGKAKLYSWEDEQLWGTIEPEQQKCRLKDDGSILSGKNS